MINQITERKKIYKTIVFIMFPLFCFQICKLNINFSFFSLQQRWPIQLTMIFIRFHTKSSLGNHSILSGDPVAEAYIANSWCQRLMASPSAEHSMTQTVFPARNLKVRCLPKSTFSEQRKALNLECHQIKGHRVYSLCSQGTIYPQYLKRKIHRIQPLLSSSPTQSDISHSIPCAYI